jgi:hypothetical protein
MNHMMQVTNMKKNANQQQQKSSICQNSRLLPHLPPTGMMPAQALQPS